MSYELYIFGSAVRGEVCRTSDVDILALPFSESSRSKLPSNWSIYSPSVIKEYFITGRLFAWHIYLESICIFSYRGTNYIEMLGAPAPYDSASNDIDELSELLREAIRELKNGTNSVVYELGIAYTAMRDIAMCASWRLLDSPCFSKFAPYKLPTKCPISRSSYEVAMSARHSSTRGEDVTGDLDQAVQDFVNSDFSDWIESIRLD
jgi:hypothetical protein